MATHTATSCIIKPPATVRHFSHKHKVYNLLHSNYLPKFTPFLQKGWPGHGININLSRLNVRKAGSKFSSTGRIISSVAALPGALLFDCDGVLVDTERDGHRVSFNEAFSEKGLNVTWDVDLYGELLKIGGGKERMTAYFNKTGWPDIAPSTEGERKELIASLHRRKTELFMALIEKRLLPLRPGVARLIDEALEKGVKVAICSTSNEKAVSAIVQCLLGPPRTDAISIFAGDIVPRKKPDPAIYLLAATTLGLGTSRCVVIEDSAIGLAAAKAAGMKCIVTKSGYTVEEDFTSADAVFDYIGDPPNANFDLNFCGNLLEKQYAS